MKDSKKKKIVIITTLLVLIIIVVIVSFAFIWNNKKVKGNKPIEEEKKLSIVDKKTFVGYELLRNNDNFFYLYKDNSLHIINDKGIEIVKFDNIENKDDILSVEFLSNKYFSVFKINDVNYLYKNDGELLVSSKDEINILMGDVEPYYIVNNTLYNINGEEVYSNEALTDIENFLVSNDYIFISKETHNIMISMGDNTITHLNRFENYTNYIVCYAKDGKSVSLLDKESGNILDYTNYEQKIYGIILYNNQENKDVLVSNSKLVKDGEKLKYDNYQFDYSLCEDGFKIFDNDNNLISDKCFDKFDRGINDEIELYENLDNLDMMEVSYLVDNKITKYSPVGEYFVEYKYDDIENGILLYDKDGNVLDNKCSSFDYDGKYYICGDTKSKYLVNNSLEKIGNDYENIISYGNDYYAVIKDNMYGLNRNEDVIIDNKYNSIIKSGNVIVAEDAYRIDFYILGEGEALDSSRLYEEFNEYNEINIDNLVKQYDLEDDINIINENEQLFKKYAYIVENNSKLSKYKRYVMKSFRTAALNKEYMNEDSFLRDLKRLNIKFVKDRPNPDLCGIYSDGLLKIEIYCDTETVVYHELTHFIDYRLGDIGTYSIYEYDGIYIDEYEYKNLDVSLKKKAVYKGSAKASFLTEGGAEINQAMYLNDNLVTTYLNQVKIYSILSYILGTDKMNEIYFSSNGDYKLFSELVNNGWDYEKYERFVELVSPSGSIYSYRPYSEKESFEVTDMMIDLYEKKNSETKWYDDKVFFYLISNYIGYAQPNSNYTNRVSEYMKIDYVKNNLIFDGIYKELKISNGARSYPILSYYINGKVYMTIYDNSDYYVVNYDVVNNKILDYKQIENKEVS